VLLGSIEKGRFIYPYKSTQSQDGILISLRRRRSLRRTRAGH